MARGRGSRASSPLARKGVPVQTPKTVSVLEMHAMQPRSNPPGAYPRLTAPLVRHHRVLRPAFSREALDRAAEGFRKSLETHGRQTTGIFSCSKSTNEINFLASKFARQVFGNNNIDSCNRT